MNYLDYIIIAVLIIYGVWGLAKGLLRLIFDLLGYGLAFLAAKFLSPYLIEYIIDTNFYLGIKEDLFNTFSRVSPTLTESVNQLTIPDSLSEIFQAEPALRDVLNSYPKLREALDQNMLVLSGEPFMETISNYVVAILAAVSIFILVKILFSVLTTIILSRNEHMPVAITNRILGMLIGVSLAIVMVALTLQTIEVYALTSSPVLANSIAESRYAHLFTSLPLLEWLQNIMPN